VKRSKNEITNADLFLYALYRLGGAGAYVDVEDVFMEMWRIAPERFRWRKYEVPNYKIMSKAIVDISQRGQEGLLLGSGDMRQLSAEGVAWAERHSEELEAVATGERAAPPDRRPGQRVVADLLKQPSVQSFLQGREVHLDRVRVARLLRCAPDAPRQVWRERLETLRSAATAGKRDDVLRFLDRLEEENPDWFRSNS